MEKSFTICILSVDTRNTSSEVFIVVDVGIGSSIVVLVKYGKIAHTLKLMAITATTKIIMRIILFITFAENVLG
jgi:hypothetical protein